VYDENMGEFTAEQQDELRTKGYITMRLFYKGMATPTGWVPASTPSFGTSTVYSCDYSVALGKYFSSGDGGKIAYSDDTDTWTQVSTTQFGSSIVRRIRSVEFLSMVIAVGDDGKLAYTTNTTTWTAATSQMGTSDIYGICVDESANIIIIVGQDGKSAWSTNGTSWNLVGVGTSPYINYFVEISDVLNDFVLGSYGRLGISNNGQSWSLNALWNVHYYGFTSSSIGRDLIVGSSGLIAYSDNGSDYTAITGSPLGVGALRTIATSNMAASFMIGGENIVGASTDGLTWTPAVFPGIIYEIRAMDAVGKFLLVGSSGAIYTKGY
jgi:hypothetical protein